MKLIELEGSWFYARTTLVIKNGVIVKTFEDIADPESNARDVANWSANHGVCCAADDVCARL
jgi:hypothetical protein